MKDHVAIVLKKDNKILFIQKSKTKKNLPLAWAFPSWTVEPNEDIFKTAEREANEELGVIVKSEEIMWTRELKEFWDKLHFVVCSIVGWEPYIKEPNEIESLAWMTFEEFFEKFDDTQIWHWLIYLRQNKNLWEKYS